MIADETLKAVDLITLEHFTLDGSGSLNLQQNPTIVHHFSHFRM